jgi:hypothetical protein
MTPGRTVNVRRIFALTGAASAVLLIVGLSLVANVFAANISLYASTHGAMPNGANYAEVPTGPSQTSSATGGPCGLLPVPGVSVVSFSNGSEACVAGPPLVVGSDGVADFRNGTKVSLGFNGWYSGLIAGTPYDTVVLENGTRILFDSSGVEAAIYPNLGEELFSNGTLVKFAACTISIDAGPPNYPYGLSSNGTVWFTFKNETTVYLYSDGTCSSLTTSRVP